MSYDLIVIGAGSAGLAAARRAASYGAKVAIVENGRMGGTCVNVGCVPKKIMWNVASVREISESAVYFGSNCNVTGELDWAKVKQRRNDYIHRLNDIYEEKLRMEKVELIEGTAVLGKLHEVIINDSQTISGSRILIATGSQPVLPKEISGYEFGITSDGFFDLGHQPKNVAVVGSGYIAAELSGIFAALGSKVRIWCRQDRIMTRFDHDIACRLQDEMEGSGRVIIYKQSNVTRIVKDESNLLSIEYIDCSGNPQRNMPKSSSGHDCLIWAIGRTPKDCIKAKEFGIAMDSANHIKVNEWQECSIPDYYAIGDATGQLMLTPVAVAAGRLLADRLFGGKVDAKMDYSNVPSVVFSHPAIGTIGLSEAEAIEKYGKENIKVYRNEFSNMHYALIPEDSRPKPSLYKMITFGKDERIIGLHIIGLSSDEILQGFAVAIKMGATKDDFNKTVAIHPTSAEEIVYF